MLQRFREIPAPQSNPEMLPGETKQAAWNDHDSLLFKHFLAELFNRPVAQPFRKSDGARLWSEPGKFRLVFLKESFCACQVCPDNIQVAANDLLFVLQGDQAKDLAWALLHIVV